MACHCQNCHHREAFSSWSGHEGDAVGNRFPGPDDDVLWDDGLGGWNGIRPGTKSSPQKKHPGGISRVLYIIGRGERI